MESARSSLPASAAQHAPADAGAAPDAPSKTPPPEETPPEETPPKEKAASEEERAVILDAILLLGALVFLLVMFYEMYAPSRSGDVLNPLLAAAVGTALVWPLRKRRAARALLFAGGLLLLFWVADAMSGVLLPFAGIYLLAFLLNPWVTRLQRRFDMPRWASAALVTVLALSAIGAFFVLIVPGLLTELQTLAGRVLAAAEQFDDTLASSSLLAGLERAGLVDADQFAGQVAAALREQAAYFADNLPRAAEQAASQVGSLLGYLVVLCVLPVALYYTVKDYPRISYRLTGLLPTFGGRRDYLTEVSSVVGNYMRGMLILSLIATVNVSVALVLLDVPFAILIGLLTGVLNMIPNLGALITAVIGVVVAAAFGGLWDALVVLLVLLGQNVLEQSVLSPKILSREVGLHPVLVLLSLFVFGYFLGLFGLLIAVPVTTLGVMVYRTYSRELTLELKTPQDPETQNPEADAPSGPSSPSSLLAQIRRRLSNRSEPPSRRSSK